MKEKKIILTICILFQSVLILDRITAIGKSIGVWGMKWGLSHSDQGGSVSSFLPLEGVIAHPIFAAETFFNFFTCMVACGFYSAYVAEPKGFDFPVGRIAKWTIGFSLFICSWSLIRILFGWIGSLASIISANSGPTLCCVTPLGIVIAILLLVIAAKD